MSIFFYLLRRPPGYPSFGPSWVLLLMMAQGKGTFPTKGRSVDNDRMNPGVGTCPVGVKLAEIGAVGSSGSSLDLHHQYKLSKSVTTLTTSGWSTEPDARAAMSGRSALGTL